MYDSAGLFCPYDKTPVTDSVYVSKQRKFNIWRSCLHFKESLVFVYICC